MGTGKQYKDEEMISWSRIPEDYHWGQYYNYACVFFANNQWELDGHDKKELMTLRDRFKKLLDGHFWIILDTHGSASSLGKSKYNMDLSMKRSNEVLKFFKDTLGSYNRFNCGRAFIGEKYAKPQRRFHSVDRKVIVRAKITMGRDPNSPFAGYERAYISRVKIFKQYCPYYNLWKRKGLFSLIEQWEKLYENDRELDLVISEKDIDKVIELLMDRMPSATKNRFQNDLKYGNRKKVVTEYYHPLYRRYYQEAYNRFSQVEDMNKVADILSQNY